MELIQTQRFLLPNHFCSHYVWINLTNHASDVESSANSCETLIALSPPAIIPMILSSIPNVGRHSDASTIPSLPLVPEPM